MREDHPVRAVDGHARQPERLETPVHEARIAEDGNQPEHRDDHRQDERRAEQRHEERPAPEVPTRKGTGDRDREKHAERRRQHRLPEREAQRLPRAGAEGRQPFGPPEHRSDGHQRQGADERPRDQRDRALRHASIA